MNGLELYSSFENESRLRGRSAPRWLRYSIHHDPNQITSLSTPESVPPTTQSSNNALYNGHIRSDRELQEKREEDDSADNELYYYNDIDSNDILHGEDNVDVIPLSSQDQFSLHRLNTSLSAQVPNMNNHLQPTTFPLERPNLQIIDRGNLFSQLSSRTTNSLEINAQRNTIRTENINNERESREHILNNVFPQPTTANNSEYIDTSPTNGNNKME